MTPTPPHTKVRHTKSYDDGHTEIDSWSNHKQLASEKQEIEQHLETNRESLALDLIKASEIFATGETEELTLKLSRDKETGEPKLITKLFTVSKAYYGK